MGIQPAMPTNARALTCLLLSERSALLRLAQRILGNATAAEDLTQTLWLRVQRVEDDPPILNKRAYLYRLATNLARDQLRADRRSRAVFEAGDVPQDRPDNRPSAESELIGRERLEILLEAIGELPPRMQQIFMMRKFDELPVAEIAQRLGLSRSSIAKSLQAALLHCDERLNGRSD